jgi:hypothetical protein
MAVLCAVGWTTWASDCLAQREQSRVDTSVKRFLKNYVGVPRSDDDKSTRYFASFADLSGHGKQEVIVYVTGQAWCGSGGCTTLILAPNDSSFRLVTRITISRPPISVLPTKSNGWHDLSVHVQGGGIQPGYDAELSFDGKTYPRNPSVAPAKPLVGAPAGEVLVPPEGEGVLLYE